MNEETTAFHNRPELKKEIIGRVADHRAADELIQGTGWENGKGCAVGCPFKTYDHSYVAKKSGVPVMLIHLQDSIFEGLPNEKAMHWATDFWEAITPGSDLSTVGWKFLHWLLTQDQIGDIKHEMVHSAVMECAAVIEPLTRGLTVDIEAARAAQSAAESAARSAAGAARAAQSAAESARAAQSAAESAARSAAGAAESAARSAAWSAWSAAWSAGAAARAESRSAAWQLMSEKLISLLREAGK